MGMIKEVCLASCCSSSAWKASRVPQKAPMKADNLDAGSTELADAPVRGHQDPAQPLAANASTPTAMLRLRHPPQSRGAMSPIMDWRQASICLRANLSRRIGHGRFPRAACALNLDPAVDRFVLHAKL
jgi:hypothetical protein